MENKKVLSIDPGTASLGWALTEQNSKDEMVKLIDAGVKIFKPVYEPQYFGLKNQTRTEKRQIRRQSDRKKRRYSKVENLLIKNRLLSKSIEDYHADDSSIQATLGSPYKLRSDALSQLLTNDELSYAILHLFKRRGFYSSLKSKSAEEKKNDALAQGVMIQVREASCQTLGEFFWKKLKSDSKNRLRVRGGDQSDFSILQGEKLLRDNLYDELELILNKQIEFGNDLLLSNDNITNKEIKSELLRQFRFQRPLKAQKRKVFCAYEIKKVSYVDKKTQESSIRMLGIKTAHKMTLPAQKFIIWQSINNLKISEIDNSTGEEFDVDIDLETKHKFFKKAWNSLELSFSAIRKEMGVSEFSRINLEFDNKKGIQGNQLLKIFKGDLGKWFKALDDEKQNSIVSEIHMIKGAEFLGLRNRLINHWGFTDENVDLLINGIQKELKPVYSSLSQKAINKLLPHFEKGLMFHEAIDIVYKKNESVLNLKDKAELRFLPTFKQTTNPIVNRSMSVVRNKINELIKKYGKIDIVRVELARDLGLSSKGLAELRSKNTANEKLNQEAIAFLTEKKHKATRSNIEKYKLWKEIKEESLFPEKVNGSWVYKSISKEELFGSSGKYEVEHLLPKSQTGNNSFMNKSICSSHLNSDKGQRTPYEYYHSLMNKEELDIWIKHIYKVLGNSPKKKMFMKTRKALESEYTVNTSLNDTRTIAVELSKYLKNAFDEVQTTKGGYTAILRKELDLNELLGDADKKSRIDLRHHMLDAIVIGLTSKTMINNLNKLKRLRSFDFKRKTDNYLILKDRILSKFKIRKEFEKHFENTITEHEVENKPKGAFDEETIYSLMRKEVITNESGSISYTKLSKVDLREISEIEDIDKKEYEDCVFVTSKPVSTLMNRKVSEVLEDVSSGKIVIPLELIEHLLTLDSDFILKNTIQLESENIYKKVKYVYKKSESKICHTVKNREGRIIGFKKLGNNFCVVGYKNGTPRVVSLYEFLNNKNIDKNDVMYKGSILQDENGNFWKVYKFSGKELCVAPVNEIVIEKQNIKKYNVLKQNAIKKIFSYYIKNNFIII